jgi:hypothetical protein
MNKRFLVLFLLSFLLPLFAKAQTQTTSVTISVTDAPDGQAWANGSYATTLVVSTLGNSNGVRLPGPTGSLDASGHATFSLTSVNDITYPVGGVWQVSVCPQMGCDVASFGAALSSPQVVGTSASYTITPPSFRIQATQRAGAIAYRDSEVVSSILGAVYFNVTSSQLKVCGALPCSANWMTSSGGPSDWGAVTAGTNSNAGTFTQSGNSWDFSGASSLKIPLAPAATPTSSGQVAYDSTNNRYVLGVNGTTQTLLPNGPNGTVYVDEVIGAGINAAPTAWVSNTAYPLCQVVSNSGNYIAVSADNSTHTPGNNKAFWYPIPNGSRPTQLDCAFYVAQSQVTSTAGVNLVLGAQNYNSCIGMTYPTVSSPGFPGVNILGAGVKNTTITQTCALNSGAGGDGLAVINVPQASIAFALPTLVFRDFTIDIHALAPAGLDLHACQQCVVDHVDYTNPTPGTDHVFEAGTVGGGSTGWVYELEMIGSQTTYNPGVTGHGHGNGAARFTVTVTGGVPSIAVTNGGANYDAGQLSIRLVKAGGLEACSSVGTNTPTIVSGVITAITSTATGCAATGSTFVQVYPGLQVSYSYKFSNMTDTRTVADLVPSIGSVCGMWGSNINNMNSYYKIHPIGTFDGICINGTEKYDSTQIDSVYNHGINIGSTFNEVTLSNTKFEWNNSYYEGSSDYYIQNINNPPSAAQASINIYGDHCGNNPQQDGYAHIVTGAGVVDSGNALPPRLNAYGTTYCNQYQSATQPNFTNLATDIIWGSGKFTSYWDWNLGSGGNTALNFWHSTGNPWSLFYLNNNAATSGANANSPIFGAKGAYWDGSASQSYGWSLQTTFASGTGPLATFKFAKSGTEPAGGHQYTWDAPVILPTGSTAVTQSTSDTSTQVANDAFVSNAIAAALAGISGVSGCTSSCHYVLTQGDAPEVNSTSTTTMTANNVPQVAQFYNAMSRKVGNAIVRVTTAGASGHFDVGIYSVSGTTATLQWHLGSQSTGSAQNISVTPAAFTLAAGTNYLIAWCADNTAATLLGITNSGNAGLVSGGTGTVANTFGTDSTDTCTAGVLPSTLTTTNITNNSAASIPYVYVNN